VPEKLAIQVSAFFFWKTAFWEAFLIGYVIMRVRVLVLELVLDCGS
jgi:hypothetical protein